MDTISKICESANKLIENHYTVTVQISTGNLIVKQKINDQ